VGVAWDVEYTDEFETWWDGLTEDQQAAVAARVERLQAQGPNLKRPIVGAIKGSRNDPQMKELRVSLAEGELRILFMFDPRRAAILLLGGDKQGQWNRWYKTAIPQADDLYDTYLDELRKEGLL
jgi:hypothetical protein